MAAKRYQVLSPDGFTIDREIDTYPSKEKAEDALTEWIKRYEKQGYYSTNGKRIPLNEIRNYCSLVPK